MKVAKLVILGLLIWALPLASALTLMHAHLQGELLDAFIDLIHIASASVFGLLAMRTLEAPQLFKGALLGVCSVALSIGLDMPVFVLGGFHMPLQAYLSDIAVTYLSTIIIVGALAAAMKQRS